MGPAIAISVLSVALLMAIIWWRKERALSSRQLSETIAALNRQLVKTQNFNQKLQALSEASGSVMVMLDRSGVVVHNNLAAERMFNVSPGALRGKPLIETTLSPELFEFGLSSFDNDSPRSQDIVMPGALGQILRVSAFRFQVGLSGEVEVMLVIVDVTELRRLETIRRDFVANVSHELRTPLASIRAMAETLEEGALHDQVVAHKFLKTIVSEADRLARISEDLLILSDAESKSPQKDWFDMHALIAEVTARFQTKAQESDISLVTNTPGEVRVRASRDQLEQVLVNLVDNAIKYTPAGGSVTISGSTANNSAVVDVSDTGIGMMEEDLPRIFERFYRVDKARSRASGGTGLGLSIVKNIIEAHGGEVRVKSEFNHGSAFTFVVPMDGGGH